MSNTSVKSFNSILSTVSDGHATMGENWMQGRAAYGGVVSAIAAQHMRQQVSKDRLFRSFMGSFIAPAPADMLTVNTDIIREGGSVSQLSTNIKNTDGQICYQAMAAFGVKRSAEVTIEHAQPMQAEPRDSAPAMPKLPTDPAMRTIPIFLNNFDIHWTGGGIPMSGENTRRVGMWVKHCTPISTSPIAGLLAIGDIPPSAVLSHYKRPIRLSSLNWSVEIVADEDKIDGSGWFYLDYRLDAAANGYNQQSGTIHSEDGTLIALSRQCMCYFD